MSRDGGKQRPDQLRPGAGAGIARPLTLRLDCILGAADYSMRGYYLSYTPQHWAGWGLGFQGSVTLIRSLIHMLMYQNHLQTHFQAYPRALLPQACPV